MTVLVALALLLLAPSPASALDEQIRTIPSRPGVTESFVLIRAPRPPVASVILFTGGRGALGLQRGSLGPRAVNFLVRSRQRFAERGLLVAVLDAPSDRTGEALVRFRTSAEHAADVRARIATLRAETPVPVWLVGTSMGSVSAAAVAAQLTEGGPDGVVLTSSVMGQNREMGESLQDVALDKIRVAWAMRRLSAAPRKELLAFSGGDAPQSDACEPLAPHGYFGIENKVVDAIVGWIIRP